MKYGHKREAKKIKNVQSGKKKSSRKERATQESEGGITRGETKPDKEQIKRGKGRGEVQLQTFKGKGAGKLRQGSKKVEKQRVKMNPT